MTTSSFSSFEPVTDPATGPAAGPVTGPAAGPATGPVAGPVAGPPARTVWTRTDSPVGPLRILSRGGAVTAIDFDDTEPPRGRPQGDRADADPVLVEACAQLADYFAGRRESFDLPLAPAGTAFQHRVWEQLRGIAYGETATYGEIARRLGLTGHGSRAVGSANGRNPIPIVVPCHRVVGSDGSLTGYAGGVARKQQLLELESHSLF